METVGCFVGSLVEDRPGRSVEHACPERFDEFFGFNIGRARVVFAVFREPDRDVHGQNFQRPKIFVELFEGGGDQDTAEHPILEYDGDPFALGDVCASYTNHGRSVAAGNLTGEFISGSKKALKQVKSAVEIGNIEEKNSVPYGFGSTCA
jgi:hypothetical protein